MGLLARSPVTLAALARKRATTGRVASLGAGTSTR